MKKKTTTQKYKVLWCPREKNELLILDCIYICLYNKHTLTFYVHTLIQLLALHLQVHRECISDVENSAQNHLK